MKYQIHGRQVDSVESSVERVMIALVNWHSAKHPNIQDKFQELREELPSIIDEAFHNDLTLSQLSDDIEDICGWIIDPRKTHPMILLGVILYKIT